MGTPGAQPLGAPHPRFPFPRAGGSARRGRAPGERDPGRPRARPLPPPPAGPASPGAAGGRSPLPRRAGRGRGTARSGGAAPGTQQPPLAPGPSRRRGEPCEVPPAEWEPPAVFLPQRSGAVRCGLSALDGLCPRGRLRRGWRAARSLVRLAEERARRRTEAAGAEGCVRRGRAGGRGCVFSAGRGEAATWHRCLRNSNRLVPNLRPSLRLGASPSAAVPAAWEGESSQGLLSWCFHFLAEN